MISPGPLLISVFVHILVAGAAFYGWQKHHEPKRVAPPRYVDAKLVKLKSETKKNQKKKQPKKVDLTKRKKQAAPKKTAPAKTKEVKPKKTQAEIDTEKRREQKRQEDIKKELERQRVLQELEEALKQEELALAEQELESEALSYMQAISQRIEQNWNRPPSARNGMRCELLIQLVPTGRVVAVSIVESSGNKAFDRSAEQAVKKIEVFPEIKEMSADVFEKYYRRLRLVFNPQDLRQ